MPSSSSAPTQNADDPAPPPKAPDCANGAASITKEDGARLNGSVDLEGPNSPSFSMLGWQFLERNNWPRYWGAPMVRASELAFRLQVRRHGVTVATTPMIVASGYAKSAHYRGMYRLLPSDDRSDRPLVAQIAGTDPSVLLESAKLLQTECDAIELNMGCPKQCAQRHGFGAYLMRQAELCREIVSTLSQNLDIPVFVKTRIFGNWSKTAEFALVLQSAGAALITIHPRTIHQDRTGSADWAVVGRLVELLDIPVVCNGDVKSFELAQECLQITKAAAVMIGRGLLSNPAMLDEKYLGGLEDLRVQHEAEVLKYEESVRQNPEDPDRLSKFVINQRYDQAVSDFEWSHSLDMAEEYLQICQKEPPRKVYVSKHLHSLLSKRLGLYPELHNTLTLFDRSPYDRRRMKIYNSKPEVAQGQAAAAPRSALTPEEDPDLLLPNGLQAEDADQQKTAVSKRSKSRPTNKSDGHSLSEQELKVLLGLVHDLRTEFEKSGQEESCPDDSKAGEPPLLLCKYFVRGHCNLGDDCELQHSLE